MKTNKREINKMIKIKLGENRTVTHKVTSVTKDNVKELVREYNQKADVLSNQGVKKLSI
jgi:predicted glycosyltransferase